MTGRGVSGRKPFLCFISKWLASLSVRYRLLPYLLDRLLPYLLDGILPYLCLRY